MELEVQIHKLPKYTRNWRFKFINYQNIHGIGGSLEIVSTFSFRIILKIRIYKMKVQNYKSTFYFLHLSMMGNCKNI